MKYMIESSIPEWETQVEVGNEGGDYVILSQPSQNRSLILSREEAEELLAVLDVMLMETEEVADD